MTNQLIEQLRLTIESTDNQELKNFFRIFEERVDEHEKKIHQALREAQSMDALKFAQGRAFELETILGQVVIKGERS